MNEKDLNNLNEQQITMLRILSNPFPDKYFEQLKQLAGDLLLQQLDDAMNNDIMAYSNIRKSRVRIMANGGYKGK